VIRISSIDLSESLSGTEYSEYHFADTMPKKANPSRRSGIHYWKLREEFGSECLRRIGRIVRSVPTIRPVTELHHIRLEELVLLL
jgi:hypothetical protein